MVVSLTLSCALWEILTQRSKRETEQMTKWIPVIVLIVLWIGTCSVAGQTSRGTYTNPVIDEIGPADPAVIRFEGTYYMYCTGDNTSYHVYTSRDLVHWTKGRRVFVPGDRNVWAPDVFRDPNDGQFYLYYTVNKRIGVAVAERPDAIFKDRVTLFDNIIDAHMFCEDGKYYLYYVQLPGFRIHVQPMKTPLEKLGRPVEIIRPTEPWEKVSGVVTEGPWMLKHKDTYYLLYSGTGPARWTTRSAMPRPPNRRGRSQSTRAIRSCIERTAPLARDMAVSLRMRQVSCGRSIISRRTIRSPGIDSFASTHFGSMRAASCTAR